MKKYLVGMALLMAAGPIWAGGIDLALSNETANLSVILNRDPFYTDQARTQDGGAEIAVGGFISEVGDNLVHGTLLARGVRQTLNSQYHISAGMKLVGGEIETGVDRENSTDSETVGALALGFQAGLLLQQSAYNPVELSFEGFYAPNITSFSDAERYGEVSVRLQVEIMPRARAYVGYRRMRFDTNDYDNVQLDRSAHFGLNISF
ncbi:YfaZ family outer membrane protein [Granulosicoccus sp. 3-233]|uniref:YfaZ family outer membrane protein n=1 Tax=Granulosicoccus sp. 3-233 TaxID=3417969 RepID=UPI003D33475D